MDTTESAKNIVLEEAQKVNEDRLDTIRNLADVIAERLSLEDQIKEAERRERQLAKEAERAGWTDAQIKRFIRTAKKPKPTKAAGTTNQSETPSSGITQPGA